MKVDTNISDLFFNTDHDNAVLTEGKTFAGYDDAKLLDNAEMTLGCLKRLGVQDLPAARELVQDFHGRV